MQQARKFYGKTLGRRPGERLNDAWIEFDLGGAEATEVYEFAPCWTCFARDPEGNGFTIHQRKR